MPIYHPLESSKQSCWHPFNNTTVLNRFIDVRAAISRINRKLVIVQYLVRRVLVYRNIQYFSKYINLLHTDTFYKTIIIIFNYVSTEYLFHDKFIRLFIPITYRNPCNTYYYISILYNISIIRFIGLNFNYILSLTS